MNQPAEKEDWQQIRLGNSTTFPYRVSNYIHICLIGLSEGVGVRGELGSCFRSLFAIIESAVGEVTK
jgi:hypothetical protein